MRTYHFLEPNKMNLYFLFLITLNSVSFLFSFDFVIDEACGGF